MAVVDTHMRLAYYMRCYLIVISRKCMFLYSAVSSPLDHSKRFTLHSLTAMFIPTPTRLLSEAF